jgi:hypothetical protein
VLIPADRVTLRSWLAWYHMLAGGAGMITTLFVAPTLLGRVSPESRPLMGLAFLAMVGLFAVVAWAGVLLSSRSPWGPPAATLVQVLQVPTVRVGSYLWTFFGGGYLVPYWQVGDGLGFVVGVKANLQLSWGGAVEATIIGVNVIPFVILWLLRRKLPSSEALRPTSDGRKEEVADWNRCAAASYGSPTGEPSPRNAR